MAVFWVVVSCSLVEVYQNRLGFEVLRAVSTKMAVFWVVAPCSLVEVYQKWCVQTLRYLPWCSVPVLACNKLTQECVALTTLKFVFGLVSYCYFTTLLRTSRVMCLRLCMKTVNLQGCGKKWCGPVVVLPRTSQKGSEENQARIFSLSGLRTIYLSLLLPSFL
jgi:hypothetical protein